jgi:hypothetical protein
MPQVLNKYKSGFPKGAIYIGRGSKWGNPFKRDDASGNTKEVVIEKHKVALAKSHLFNDLDELTGKDLICFCAPKACHGDILLYLANMPEEDRNKWRCDILDNKNNHMPTT